MELKNVIKTHSEEKWKGSLKYFKDKNLKLLIGEDNFNSIKNSMDETLTSPVSLMVYCFLNDITQHPKCVCGKNNKFDPNQKKFSKYCCKKCSMENAKDAYEIRKNNNLKKYGVENVFQLKETKDKIKSTSLEKYGQESYTKTEEYRNSKIQQNSSTCLNKFKNIHGDRYDYSKFVYSGKLERSVVICSEHGDFEINYANHMRGYGCPKCSKNKNNFIGRTKEQFLQEVEELYGGLYDLSKFDFVDSNTKGIVICPKHGEFLKTPKKLITRNQGCPTCSGKKKLTLEDIREKLKYDYIIPDQEYINNKTKLEVICPDHGAWNICAGNLINSEQRCPACAGNLSKIEEELREYISTLGVDFIKNDKTILDKLELDILIPSHNLAIELNGLYHHSDAKNKTDKYHLGKTEGCEKNNLQLLHIFEDEWRNKREIWESIIRHKLGLTVDKIFARKCVIKSVNKHDKDTFLFSTHLQGSCLSSVNLGLYHNNVLVALLSMGKSRFDKSYEWEILRYSCLLNTSVIGGFQKLIKHFTKTNQPKNILTYADVRYSIGNVYEVAGFKPHGKTIPNFFYFKRGEGVRYSRMKFQKHKLKDVLKDFDEELTESDNMKLNGYCKIWDCGSYKFTLDL
jgi:G:T-mismatch repair DNA endonuclease (very short patch repair protein)